MNRTIPLGLVGGLLFESVRFARHPPPTASTMASKAKQTAAPAKNPSPAKQPVAAPKKSASAAPPAAAKKTAAAAATPQLDYDEYIDEEGNFEMTFGTSETSVSLTVRVFVDETVEIEILHGNITEQEEAELYGICEDSVR